MTRILLLLITITITSNLSAQVTNYLQGIVRQNYYSTVVDPFDSTITYQQFDSATIRLGYLNPVTGFVNNTGIATYAQAVNLTGTALDPYENTYIFIGEQVLILLIYLPGT